MCSDSYLFFSDYVSLIKQAVVERRRVECTTYTSAREDIKVVNGHIPPALTTSYTAFDKTALIDRHRSRFNRQ